MKDNFDMKMDYSDYWEEYLANLEKPEEEYEREKEACSSLYNDSLKSKSKEAKNKLFECMETLDEFLRKMNMSVDTFVKYIDCSVYDKNFLCQVDTIRIEEGIMRDYYSSVF